MVDAAPQPDRPVDPAVGDDSAPGLRSSASDPSGRPIVTGTGRPQPPPWSQVWHIPALLLGIGLLSLGVWMSLPSRPADDFDGSLDSAQAFLVANNFEGAKKQLDQIIRRLERATPAQVARFHLLQGDLIYLEQAARGWDQPTNHEATIKSYHQAEQGGQPIDEAHKHRWAMSLAALGREDEALAMMERLPGKAASYRYPVVRRILDGRLDRAERSPGRADDDAESRKIEQLIVRFQSELAGEADPVRRRAQQMWSYGVRGRLLLSAGQYDTAIAQLLRQLTRLMEQGRADDLAPLRVLLAEAYRQIGEWEEARRQYQLAQSMITRSDRLNVKVLVGLGQLAMIDRGGTHSEHDGVRTALEHFAAAERDYADQRDPDYLQALIGRADCEARLGNHNEAIDHFKHAARLVVENGQRVAAERDHLIQSVLAHHGLNYDRGGESYVTALDYLQTLLPLYASELPTGILALLATSNERIARFRLSQGQADLAAADPRGLGVNDPSPAARLAFQTAATHFDKAGDYYAAHANAAMNTGDLKAFGDTLWQAALCYDAAQRWEKSIDAYNSYIKSLPGDARQLEARFRVAQAYQAKGDATAAADLYARLIEEHPRSEPAYASLVPLARAQVALGHHQAALELLRGVVVDHPALTPDSQTYRWALIELGRLHYRMGQWVLAIERLDEAVARYAQAPDAALMRFMLADSYRRSVDQLDQDLQQPMAQSKRSALQSERADRLGKAQVLYNQVVSELSARPRRSLSALEEVYFRNSYFYRADCAYDLGRYEEAIGLYDMAAKAWDNHPASLVALVQIVNSYSNLNRPQEARVVNERARAQLRRIPDSAFEDPTLPMSRKHWQEWLRWSGELNLFSTQASAENPRQP